MAGKISKTLTKRTLIDFRITACSIRVFLFMTLLLEWFLLLGLTSFRSAFETDTIVHTHSHGGLIATDGKVLRSVYNRKERCSTLHMISVFARRIAL